MTFRPWDVWLADVRFDDIPDSKRRPVIVTEDNGTSVLVLKCTSKPARRGEYVLRYWQDAGLMVETTVRIAKILELDEKSFIKNLGRLHPYDILELRKRI